MLSGTGFLPIQTYSPDGTMLAEMIANSDLSRVISEFSCILAGARAPPAAQTNIMGYVCFDIATPGTFGRALATQQPLFGTECGGQTVGDGKITIEDVVIALMVHYSLPPYDTTRVNMTSTTTTAPLTSYTEQCALYEAHTDVNSAPVVPGATCDQVAARRRLQSGVHHTFEVVENKPNGMWVRLSISSPRELATATLHLKGLPVPTNAPTAHAANTWASRAAYELPPVSFLVDRQGTAFTYGITSNNTLSGSQWSGTFGRPTLYAWTTAMSLCIQELSTLSYIGASDNVYTFPADECLQRTLFPPPASPPPSSPPPSSPPPPPSASPSPPPSASPSPPASPPGSAPVGAIVGGAVGGVVALLVCVAVCLYRRRPPRRARVSSTRTGAAPASRTRARSGVEMRPQSGRGSSRV